MQINIGHLNEEGVYTTGQFSTFALTGAVRAQVGMAPPSRGTTVAWWCRMCRGGLRQSVDARGGSASSWALRPLNLACRRLQSAQTSGYR